MLHRRYILFQRLSVYKKKINRKLHYPLKSTFRYSNINGKSRSKEQQDRSNRPYYTRLVRRQRYAQRRRHQYTKALRHAPPLFPICYSRKCSPLSNISCGNFLLSCGDILVFGGIREHFCVPKLKSLNQDISEGNTVNTLGVIIRFMHNI